MSSRNSTCSMQVVFVDIVAYSKRKTHAQVKVIDAFMKSLEEALSETARQYIEYTHKNVDLNIRRDVVLLPAGDGAAIAFPFEGLHEMHLSFSRHLFRIVDQANKQSNCDFFREHGWCDCHSAFQLRCGISEGKLILYKDLNSNYNIAGDTVNMAARVMGLAGGGQIIFTERGYSELAELVPGIDKQFRRYPAILIKHNVKINLYQYIDSNQPGIDVSCLSELGTPEEPEPRQKVDLPAVAVVRPESLTTSQSAVSRPAPERYRDGSGVIVTSNPILDELSQCMVMIPAGEFLMGSDQTGQMQVEISRPFLLAKYPVTQALFKAVVGKNPSRFIAIDKPIESVSWNDAAAFCNAVSRVAGLELVYDTSAEEVVCDLSKDGYRLPTEAEWEYACLAGGRAVSYGPIGLVAWYNKNSDGQTHPVGAKAPNSFTLCDMLGNVWEWCGDWFQKKYPTGRQVDYAGPTSGLERVIRGGSWSDLPDSISSRSRYRKPPTACEATVGFRVARRSRN